MSAQQFNLVLREMTCDQLEAIVATYKETNEAIKKLTTRFNKEYNNSTDELEKQMLQNAYNNCREAMLLALTTHWNQICN